MSVRFKVPDKHKSDYLDKVTDLLECDQISQADRAYLNALAVRVTMNQPLTNQDTFDLISIAMKLLKAIKKD